MGFSIAVIRIRLLARILMFIQNDMSDSFGGIKRMRPCDESIRETLDLVENMLDLADRGDVVREDSGCGVLYGVLRDSAFRIKRLAETEKEAHVKKGWWK